MPADSVSVLMVQAAVAFRPAVLVGEHHHLQPVVGHMAGEVLVDLHHRVTEIVPVATNREFCPRIRRPFGKSTSELFVVPGEKEVAEFVVVDGVSVGWISYP